MPNKPVSKNKEKIISDEDRFHFDTQGFLVIRKVLSQAKVNALLEKFNEINARGLYTTYL